MSTHLSRLRLFQRHLLSLVWVWWFCGAWVGSGSGFGIGFTLLLTRSSPSRHPPFTQYPSPSRSLVRDGQTSPHKPRLVVPHSTCPSLSPSPPAHSFIIGPAVINKHQGAIQGDECRPRRRSWSRFPLLAPIRDSFESRGLCCHSCFGSRTCV